MKKIITLSITSIFCLVISANAQINKGSIMIGGTLNGYFSNIKNPDTVSSKTSNFSIQPAIGFAVDTNTIVGFSILYGSRNEKYYSTDQKTKSFGAGIFLRKYKSLGKSFYLFGESGLMYYHSSYNYSSQNNSSEYDSKDNSINLYITPGIAYSLTRAFQLEAGMQNLLSVGYSSATEKSKTPDYSDYKTSNFSFSSSLNPISFSGIFIGIRFLINK